MNTSTKMQVVKAQEGYNQVGQIVEVLYTTGSMSKCYNSDTGFYYLTSSANLQPIQTNQLQDANLMNEQELFDLALEHLNNNHIELMEQIVEHMVTIGFSRDEIIEEMISKMEVGQ